MRDVYSLIRKLGATSKYKGYYFVAEAIKVSMELEERPIKVTKDVYPVLAKRFKSTPSNIEHNIRTLVNICWMSHRDVMEEIAGYTLEYRPTNSEFLDILVYSLCRLQEGRQQQYMVHRRRTRDYICSKEIPCLRRKSEIMLSQSCSGRLSGMKDRKDRPVVHRSALFLY